MRGRLIGAMAVVGLLVVVVALSGGRSPAAGQAKPAVKKLDFPHVTPPPESSGTAFKWMAEELTKRSGGALNVVFHGGTLLTKELEIMDAVKSGNVAIGRNLDEIFQKKYKVKILFFYDYGFRHFWNNRRPITTPADLKGLKMR